MLSMLLILYNFFFMATCYLQVVNTNNVSKHWITKIKQIYEIMKGDNIVVMDVVSLSTLADFGFVHILSENVVFCNENYSVTYFKCLNILGSIFSYLFFFLTCYHNWTYCIRWIMIIKANHFNVFCTIGKTVLVIHIPFFL